MKLKNITTICCADSAYGLLLYFLITGKNAAETFFFFSDKVPQKYRTQLVNSKFMKVPKSDCKLLHYFCQIFYAIILPFFYKKHHFEKLPAYGFDFMEWTNPILLLSKEFYLLEDGYGSYTMPPIEAERFRKSVWRRFLVKHFSFFNLPFGLSSRVKEVFLTGLLSIPEEIGHKVRLVDLKTLWINHTELFRRSIIDFFCCGFKIEKYQDRSILLLTQCWSEANIMSEIEKIDLYSRIIKRYGVENIVLKTHPRETTDYKKVFPELEIITEPIPYQLLDLMGMRFNTAISVNSTAIFSMSVEIKKLILIEEYVVSSDIYRLAIEKINQLEK